MSNTVLGIDVGSSAVKAVLATPDGDIVETAEYPQEITSPRPGWFEQDADAMWWTGIRAVCEALARRQRGPLRPDALCVSGVGPCVLLADVNLHPLRSAILYGIDTRASREITELETLFGAERILARGGSELSSQAVGPKLAWLARYEPATFALARRLLMPSSYAVARLTNEYVLDHHSASQCDPLYDMTTGSWAEDWWSEVAGAIEPPPLVWPADHVGDVTPEAAGETGLPVGTPVVAGTIDAWAEAFSVGVRHPGDLMIMYGSTMFFVQAVSDRRPHHGLWLTAGAEPGAVTRAAGMSTSGSVTVWLKRLVGDIPFDQLIDEARAVPPGSDGLLLLPYFAGERSPIYDPDARGVIAGLTLSHGRGHLLRAIYEGTALAVRQNLEHFDQAGLVGRLVMAGGGAQSDLWTQIVSDVTGREQLQPRHTIGASYGDSLLAAIGAGVVPPETDWSEIHKTVTPNPEDEEAYRDLVEPFLALYQETADLVHALAHRHANGQP